MATVTGSQRNKVLVVDTVNTGQGANELYAMNQNVRTSDNVTFNNVTIAGSISGYATESYVGTQISNLVDSSPSTLNTLNELAAALGDDPNFATTVSNSIGTKWTQDNTRISNWNTAYGWGNHASAGYTSNVGDITAVAAGSGLSGGGTSGTVTVNVGAGDGIDTTVNTVAVDSTVIRTTGNQTLGGIKTFSSEIVATGGNSGNWNTAYGWGNHASAGYITGNQTITLSGDVSGSGTTSISVTVNDDSHFHHRLDSTDDRDMKPSTSGIATSVQALKPFFSSYGGMTGTANTTYVDVLAFDTYSDSSGGGPSAITFKKGNSAGNPEMHIWKAGWNATTWSTGQRVYADNYHPNADTLTTARTIAGTSFNGSANIDISYNNLTNKPTIPTNNNQLTNGAGYITDGNTNWNNTYGFITSSDSSITNKLPLAGGTMTGDLTIPSKIIHSGDTNTYLQFDTDRVRINAGGTTKFDTNVPYLKKGTDIPGSADLNTYTSAGFYHQNSNANAGSGSNYPVSQAGMLTVTADGAMVYQTYQQYNGTGYYHRSYYNGTWYAWRQVFNDNYHPNADKWTTARTITLGGDLTGNVSINGSANVTLTATVADGSGSGLDADLLDGQEGSYYYAC